MYELISMNYVQFNNFLTPFFLFYEDDVNNFLHFCKNLRRRPLGYICSFFDPAKIMSF